MVKILANRPALLQVNALAKLWQQPEQLTTTDWHPTTDPSLWIGEVTQAGKHYFGIIASTVSPTLQANSANQLPVCQYKRLPQIEMVIDDWVGHFPPVLTFQAPDQTAYKIWQIDEADDYQAIIEALQSVTSYHQLQAGQVTTHAPLIFWVADTELSQANSALQLTIPSQLWQQA